MKKIKSWVFPIAEQVVNVLVPIIFIIPVALFIIWTEFYHTRKRMKDWLISFGKRLCFEFFNPEARREEWELENKWCCNLSLDLK